MYKAIGIAGFGAFGFAMAKYISRQLAEMHQDDSKVYIYDADHALMSHLERKRRHKYLFKKVNLEENIIISSSAADLFKESELVVMCIPVQKVRPFLQSVKKHITEGTIILNSAKGMEYKTGNTVQDIFRDVIGGSVAYKYAFISGGMIASEFIRSEGVFAADLCCNNRKTRDRLRSLFASETLSINTLNDVKSSETLSALKNVVAIGVGFLEGLEYQYSTKALFIAASFQEIRSYSYSVSSAARKNAGGLSTAFIGDYITSTTGDTRNKELGQLVGKGKNPHEAVVLLSNRNKTAEGFWTVRAIADALKMYKERFPILNMIYEILHESRDVHDIIRFMDKR